ncbi:MAG TPA: CPBP family intramembrane glutamic endopeptidase [Candidatus Polarisedimenticolaceae bacterium]|nr:CPBP family intramembrane glutamic endopeptidase [Candidatus Polarisedimenticolaceae bacterium]
MGSAGASFLVVFGLLLPYLAIKSARRLATRPLPPKKPFFRSIIVQLLIFAAIAIVVGAVEHVDLFPRRAPSPAAWGWGLLALTVFVLGMRPQWRKRVVERSRRAWLFMPRDGTERALWIGSSVAAGFSEELVYRGVLTTLLFRMTGSFLAAALVSAAIFAISHYMQAARSMTIIFGIALVFQALAWVSGSLYVPMAVHAVYDILAGLHYDYFGRKLGYPVEPLPA